jgi:hypothetical protein
VGELWPREVDVGVAAVKIGSRDGRGEEEEKKIRSGGRQLLQVEMDFRVRFPFFFCIFFQNCPPMCVLKTNIYRQKYY